MESSGQSSGELQNGLFSRFLLANPERRQDLNCSIMTKSNRMFDHTVFAELQWKRDSFSPAFYSILPGFEKRLDVLSAEFVEVLQDIHALQRMRDSPHFVCEDITEMIRVDNHQASVQSRLVLLPRVSSFSECCHLAAYISACQLCYKVWRASTIPVSGYLHSTLRFCVQDFALKSLVITVNEQGADTDMAGFSSIGVARKVVPGG